MKRLILPAMLFLLTATACKKGPYTCVCRDQGNGYGDQQYTIRSEDQGVASYECEKYAISLNSGGGQYQCTLH